MIASAARLASRRVFHQSRRTLLDVPNKVTQIQAEIQKGATPWLRGEADPTYLRQSGDKLVAQAGLAAVALGWVLVLGQHFRMWNGKK